MPIAGAVANTAISSILVVVFALIGASLDHSTNANTQFPGHWLRDRPIAGMHSFDHSITI